MCWTATKRISSVMLTTHERKGLIKYELRLHDGHMMISLVEGIFIIDTGAPTSFSRRGKLSFGGRQIDVPINAMGMLDADTLSGYVGTRLDGLIGMDVLKKFKLTFFARSTLFVEKSGGDDNSIAPISDSSFLPLETNDFMGIPVVSMKVDKRPVRMFVDTGAKVSYLDPQMLVDFKVEGTIHDFYPGVGEFDVDISTVWCDLNGWPFPAKFGRLPALLQMTLMFGGVDGIIGHDIFDSYTIRFECGGRPIRFVPHI